MSDLDSEVLSALADSISLSVPDIHRTLCERAGFNPFSVTRQAGGAEWFKDHDEDDIRAALKRLVRAGKVERKVVYSKRGRSANWVGRVAVFSRSALVVLAVLACTGCASSQSVPSIVFTSQDGIAFENRSGAVHFYKFNSKGSNYK